MSINKALFTSNKDDWFTPKNVLDLVEMVDDIHLDPCYNYDSIVDANITYCSAGLDVPWRSHGLGLVFCNPPYSQISEWANKIDLEARSGTELIALIPARTDTRWFRCFYDSTYVLAFWHGRIRFIGGEHGAPFPSVLIYAGNRRKRFCDVFGGVASCLVKP